MSRSNPTHPPYGEKAESKMNSNLAYDNVVLRFFNKVTDLVVLNLLFLLTSLPVFTMGTSLTALYAVNLRSIRYGDGYVVRTYWGAFKKNFRQATLAWLFLLAAGGILFLDYRFWKSFGGGTFSRVQLVLIFVLAFCFILVGTWLFPVIAKMEGSLKHQIGTAAKMAVGYFLPYTFFALTLTGLAIVAAFFSMGGLVIMGVLGIALVTYLQSFFFYKVFARHIREEALGADDPLYGGSDHE